MQIKVPVMELKMSNTDTSWNSNYSLLLPSSTTVPGFRVDYGGSKHPVKWLGVGLVGVQEVPAAGEPIESG